MTYYDENGEGGFTSDLSTSVFDFFFFVSFLASCFNFLASFFANPLSVLAMSPAHCVKKPSVRVEQPNAPVAQGSQASKIVDTT